MRVLLAHNFYRSSAPSGEDSVYTNERALLEREHEVIAFERFNDDIDESSLAKKVRLAVDGAWSEKIYREIIALIQKTKPEIAHFHNTFPLISPSAYAACRDQGVPVVQTLHNYRFICPNALLMRNHQPCEDCLGSRLLLPALRHRCYRGSLLATGAQVWTVVSNRWRGTYAKLVNRYVALTRFAVPRLIAGGLPENRIEVKPNFLPDPPVCGRGDGGYALYVGRLSEEKGVQTLLDAWRSIPELPLKIVGEGSLRSRLENQVRQDGSNVEFLGFQGRSTVIDLVCRAALQVIPSECYEGFPLTLLEAYSCGTPVLVSRIGSLDELVKEGETGFKFQPGSSEDMVFQIKQLLKNPRLLIFMRERCRAIFEAKYTAEINIAEINKIYQHAIEDAHLGKDQVDR
ncbi:glycosyltransferase family 4 protein [Methylocaldum sp. GT1BB]|jgi:glycosyltransferase involved in cell wall biosynthesis|uniref:glycosyltransferase family 4 protein n=1 Tax=Methylocaldum sp. GT1BB TaxID=3438963 RepID=UPI003DA02A27